MTISNTRAVINSSGDFESGKLNMEAQVYVDRLPLETISHILDNDLQLAIKIIDYEATTTDGINFDYLKKLKVTVKEHCYQLRGMFQIASIPLCLKLVAIIT